MIRARSRLVGAALLVAGLAGFAGGQIKVDDIRLGWNKHATIGRWMPVTLDVTGGPAGFAGTVVIEFPMDVTQRGETRAPIAATPGRSASVMVPVCLSGSAAAIEVRIEDDRRVVFRRRLLSDGLGDEALDLDQSTDNVVVLAAGNTTVVDLPRPLTDAESKRRLEWLQPWMQEQRKPDPELDRMLQYARVQVAPLGLGALPSDSLLYEGIECVVLGESGADGEQTLGSAQEEAIKLWVRAGGWLVVQSRSGDAWRRWVEDQAGATPIEVEPAESLMLPPSAREEIGKLRDVGVDGGDPAAGLELAERVTGRRIKVVPEGAAAGWKVRWPLEGRGGLIAEGPVGLGMVTVLGFEPQATSKVLSRPLSRAAWRGVLTPALDRSVRRGLAQLAGTEPDPIRAALSAMSIRPRVGKGYLDGIVLGMGLLAILVGPVDLLWLRRNRMQHRGWLTALGWIGLASATGYALPLIFRKGPSELSQVSVLDAVARADGSLDAAQRTVVHGMMGQRPTSVRIGTEGEPSWVRGICSWQSSISGMLAGMQLIDRDRPIFGPLQMGLARGEAGAGRGMHVDRVGLPQWSFRAVTSDGPALTPGLRVTCERGADGGLRFDLVGLGEGVMIDRAWATDGARRLALQARATSETGWTLTAPGPGPATGMGDAKALVVASEDPRLALPGAERRGEAHMWRRRGGFVTLEVEASHLPTAGHVIFGDGVPAMEHAGTLRISVPVKSGGGA